MIITETITINEIPCKRQYSDQGFYLSYDGVLYVDAIDPIDSQKTYTETDILIEEMI